MGTITDRELLELAAKATGMRALAYHGEGILIGVVERTNAPIFWNPLTDDGDALRLAVKLSMQLGSNADSDIAGASWVEYKGGMVYCSEPHKGDAGKATRRAIVKCAATVGKALP